MMVRFFCALLMFHSVQVSGMQVVGRLFGVGGQGPNEQLGGNGGPDEQPGGFGANFGAGAANQVRDGMVAFGELGAHGIGQVAKQLPHIGERPVEILAPVLPNVAERAGAAAAEVIAPELSRVGRDAGLPAAEMVNLGIHQIGVDLQGAASDLRNAAVQLRGAVGELRGALDSTSVNIRIAVALLGGAIVLSACAWKMIPRWFPDVQAQAALLEAQTNARRLELELAVKGQIGQGSIPQNPLQQQKGQQKSTNPNLKK